MATMLCMLFAGVAIIDQVVVQLNRRILELEAERIVGVIDDYQKALEDSGLAGLESYRKSLESELSSKFKNFKFERTGALFIRSPSGTSITGQASESSPWEKILAKKSAEGSIDFLDPFTQAPKSGVFKSARNGWKVAITIDRAEIFEKRNLYFRIVVFVGAIVLCLVMALAYYFAKRISDQINKILDTVKRVAKGDLYARIGINPVCDEHGELQDGINTMIDNLRIRDIERERAEEEARKHQKLESIGILAGGIAHDFNNLLTAIRGNLQLAQMFNNSPDAKQCLADSEKAAVRAMDLTRQLLTFAKGGMPVKSTASIGELIENNATFVLRGTKSKCEFDFAQDLRPVDIDAGQIGQAIDNLVINANQAMPDGGIVRIRAENISLAKKTPLPLATGDYVKISIADQGIGIPKSNLAKIFDPFFTTKTNGSGLGLSTTYTILKKHGGHIAVDSELGVGTIFFLYLPASKGLVRNIQGVDDGKYCNGGKILIMDDQDSIRNLLTKMLSIMNCECESAEDGSKAIEKYVAAKSAGTPFDLVFMDLTIRGGMGGKDTIEALLKIDANAVAVVASGYSNDPIMANYQSYGFKGRLDKPFKMQDLAKLLNSLLKGKHPLPKKKKAHESHSKIAKMAATSQQQPKEASQEPAATTQPPAA